MKWFYSTKFLRNLRAHYSVHNKMTKTTTTTMEDTTVSEAIASVPSSTSSTLPERNARFRLIQLTYFPWCNISKWNNYNYATRRRLLIHDVEHFNYFITYALFWTTRISLHS
jgi:hypothetical protein